MTPLPRIDGLRTERLLLRRWRQEDCVPFAALNADPVVMEHLPATLTRAVSDAAIVSMEQRFEANGFGLWAVERLDTHEMIGFVGLNPPAFEAHFTPAVEIGWRLTRSAWGRGFATEAALRVVDAAFADLGLDELVSFTVVANERSRAVMRRIGMHHDPADDFDHPSLPDGDPLQRHVLYRLAKPEWSKRRRAGQAPV